MSQNKSKRPTVADLLINSDTHPIYIGSNAITITSDDMVGIVQVNSSNTKNQLIANFIVGTTNDNNQILPEAVTLTRTNDDINIVITLHNGQQHTLHKNEPVCINNIQSIDIERQQCTLRWKVNAALNNSMNDETQYYISDNRPNQSNTGIGDEITQDDLPILPGTDSDSSHSSNSELQRQQQKYTSKAFSVPTVHVETASQTFDKIKHNQGSSQNNMKPKSSQSSYTSHKSIHKEQQQHSELPTDDENEADDESQPTKSTPTTGRQVDTDIDQNNNIRSIAKQSYKQQHNNTDDMDVHHSDTNKSITCKRKLSTDSTVSNNKRHTKIVPKRTESSKHHQIVDGDTIVDGDHDTVQVQSDHHDSNVHQPVTTTNNKTSNTTNNNKSNQNKRLDVPKKSSSKSTVPPAKITANKKRNSNKYLLMFTGKNRDVAADSLVTAELGATEADDNDSINEIMKTSYLVLVTDAIRRTDKFLTLYSTSAPIVNRQWIDECAARGEFIDTDGYELSDEDAEKKYKFKINDRNANKKFLSGIQVYALPSVQPSHDKLSHIVTAAGGVLLKSAPKKYSEDIIIIACQDPETGEVADQDQVTKLNKSGYTIYNNEIILTGVLRQTLDDDPDYIIQLSNKHTKQRTTHSSYQDKTAKVKPKTKGASKAL